jgi:hypothetical protein
MNKDIQKSSENEADRYKHKEHYPSSLSAQIHSKGRRKASTDSVSMKHWEVLLGEFVHLLSLFITKSQDTNDGRTAEVIIDQLIRHLGILGKIPDNDGTIFIRRTHCKIPMPPLDNDYFATCGALLIKVNKEAAHHNANYGTVSEAADQDRSLLQAFKCFSDRGIHAIRIQMPHGEASKIDKLRLALNIMAHFKRAADDGSSIRIRYYGRALTFSVIHDANGRSDINLTLTAALNGMSPANARELVKQADAFHQLNINTADNEGGCECVSSYNRIFSVRGLRTQIIKPPVEVNNIPWLEVDGDTSEGKTCPPSISEKQVHDKVPSAQYSLLSAKEGSNRISPYLRRQDSPDDIKRILSQYIDMDIERTKVAVQALMADDYAELETVAIGKRLVSITKLMYAIEKQCQDPATIARVVEFYRHRLKKTTDAVLSDIIPQRQGIKIMSRSRTVIVGLVHPKLLDLIMLVSENIAARRRTDIIRKIAFHFDPCHMSELANGFGISEKDAHHILEILKDCFSTRGRFVRPTFEGRLSLIAEFDNAIFEILWCFLKETPRRQDRLDFINALQLLMAKLKNPKRGVRFILADICQTPDIVEFTDRNAFSLANILLHRENKELYVDINRTPENVLTIGRNINKEVRQYTIWRLDADRIRMLTKLRTIHHTIEETLHIPPGESGPFEISFLLALEREALIFLGIVGGFTARIFLRELLHKYGTLESQIYQHESSKLYYSDMMAQLQIVVRALGRAGNMEDVEVLQELGEQSKVLYGLDPHPAHKLKVGQLMKWIPDAIKMIRG